MRWRKAVETEGQSLIDGLENLVTDLEANNGELVVRLADESAFELGGNIATTPGDVVYRNRMMELIQYKPVTETVHETPDRSVPALDQQVSTFSTSRRRTA